MERLIVDSVYAQVREMTLALTSNAAFEQAEDGPSIRQTQIETIKSQADNHLRNILGDEPEYNPSDPFYAASERAMEKMKYEFDGA